MRALVQRVKKAEVRVGEEVAGRINRGLVVLLGVAKGDTEKDARYLADKIAQLRLFPDDEEHFNLSVLDINAEILVVSQFTLLADLKKGRRPDFTQAAPSAEAKALYETFIKYLKEWGLKVEQGRFGEYMLVEIHNDGPVTIWLDSRL